MCYGGQESSTPKETTYQRALAAVAKAKWKDYRQRFIPLEKKAIKDVTSKSTSKVMQSKVGGQVNADLAQKNPLSAIPAGIDPSMGSFTTGTQGIALASRGGTAMADAKESAANLRTEGLKAAVDIGRGQATDAQLGMQDLASASVKKSISDTYTNFEEETALKNTIGSMAGAGLGIGSELFTKYKGQ